MPWFRVRGRSVLTPFLAALLVLTGVAEEREAEPPPASEPAARRAEGGRAVESPSSVAEEARPDEVRIPSRTACVDAGYLCDEVERHGSLRVVRFPLDTEIIRVRVPLPEHERPERARTLRRAVMRGISAWQDRPFEIRFLDEDAEEEADLVLRWEAQLSDGGLGETRSRFLRDGRVPDYRVVDLTLATRNPYDAEKPLPPEHVELTAAHEMGHALGLPHSADRRDLMYPTDAAKSLSERDFRTVEALYSLPNGARIVP